MGYVTSGSYIPTYYSGPYHYGSNAYVLMDWRYTTLNSGSTAFYVFKGWYNTSGWSIVDQDNTPKYGRIQDACYDGERYIYVVTDEDVGATEYLRFHKFDLSTETWVVEDVLIKSASSFPQWLEDWIGKAGIDIDSNGKLYVWYNGTSSKGYYRALWAYSTDSGSSWTTDQTIPTGVGTKVSEYCFNIHTHGTNVYFWYNWNDGDEQILRCRVFNGTDWSNESSVTPYSVQTFCRGRAIHWTSSGSELVTQLFVAPYDVYHRAYSADTTTGSQPNWGNLLLISDVTDQTPHGGCLYDNKPFVLIAWYNGTGDPLQGAYSISRTSYSAWGSPVLRDSQPDPCYFHSTANPVNTTDMVYVWGGVGGSNSETGNVYYNWYDEAPPGAFGGIYYFMY